MRYILLLLSLFILNLNLFAQNCAKANLPNELVEKTEIDTIYKQDVQFRMEYYAKLSTKILPKYFGLKNLIKQKINIEDRVKIKNLAKSYEHNRVEYLNEIKENQSRIFQNSLAYRNLNNLLIFETFSLFPDSYAMLLNKTIIHRRVNQKDEMLIDELYSKYNSIQTINLECITEMQTDIKKAKQEFKIVELFQNTGNKTKKDTVKTELINLLIWATK